MIRRNFILATLSSLLAPLVKWGPAIDAAPSILDSQPTGIELWEYQQRLIEYYNLPELRQIIEWRAAKPQGESV